MNVAGNTRLPFGFSSLLSMTHSAIHHPSNQNALTLSAQFGELLWLLRAPVADPPYILEAQSNLAKYDKQKPGVGGL